MKPRNSEQIRVILRVSTVGDTCLLGAARTVTTARRLILEALEEQAENMGARRVEITPAGMSPWRGYGRLQCEIPAAGNVVLMVDGTDEYCVFAEETVLE
jgi:hypothetical protein